MRPIHAIYAVSGLLSLGYQVAWFRIFEDQFGSSQRTFAFVLINFLGGLAAGSLASRAVSARLARPFGAADPVRIYGLVELLVAITAALSWLLPLVPASVAGPFPYELVGNVFEPSSSLCTTQLIVSVACVFVPCFFMGVTFPLLCDGFRRDARFPAALYAWNTLGAASGVLLGEFVLLPSLGHWQLLNAMVVGNLLLGVFCVVGNLRAESGPGTATPPVASAAAASASSGYLLAVAVIAGLATGAFEADVLRRLQFFDCRTGAALSCISFWAILAIFLASVVVRVWSRMPRGFVHAAPALALAYYFAIWNTGWSVRDRVQAADKAAVEAALHALPGAPHEYVFFDFVNGMSALLWFTGLFVLPPFFLLALQLPFVCNRAQADERHLGRIYGANAVAFCIGMVWFAVLAPLGNQFHAMRSFFVVLALAALAMLVVRPTRRTSPVAAAGFAAALAVGGWLAPADFAPGWFPPGSAAAQYPVRAVRSDGRTTTFVVAEPPGDVLWFDSYRMTGANAVAQQYMRLMAHVPLLVQAEPRRALLICFGAGMTASAIACHASLERIDVVDLNDQVFATAPEFASSNRDVIADPRLRLVHDDGRRFLTASDERYDFITSEPPPPMVAGVARLYSVDYYRDARRHLTPGGVMSQWLPIDQMPRPAMRAAIASFLAVFPESFVFVGADTNYILMGCNGSFALDNLERRWNQLAPVRDDLKPFGIRAARDLFVRFTWSPAQLAAEFGADPLVDDAKNLFSHCFHDPERPPVLGYEPLGLLAGVRAAAGKGLACDAAIAHVVLHLGRLKSLVPDFPAAALASVPATAADQVELAGAPWTVVEQHMDAAYRLLASAPQRAASHLQAALELAPGYLAAARELGVLALQHRDWEAALRAWRLVAAADDQDVEGHAGVVLSLLQTGRKAEGLDAARAAVRRFPETAAMHRLLGDALASLERWREAIAAYDDALRIDPQDQAAKTGRAGCVGK